jgi:hypothetical protein
MDISMPRDFPANDFRAFGLAARNFFPKILSDEALNDPLERLRHFTWAWQAVRYRYRLSFECSEEFRSLIVNASDSWRKGDVDEELAYKLERRIYVFFVSGLSVFESLGFCLYFLGNRLQPTGFSDVANPKKITLAATTKGFEVSFPQATITQRLTELSKQPEFTALEGLRNILVHRLPGRRSVQSWGTVLPDGTYEPTLEETWYMPGSNEKLTLDEEMLQRHLHAEILGMVIEKVLLNAESPDS